MLNCHQSNFNPKCKVFGVLFMPSLSLFLSSSLQEYLIRIFLKPYFLSFPLIKSKSVCADPLLPSLISTLAFASPWRSRGGKVRVQSSSIRSLRSDTADTSNALLYRELPRFSLTVCTTTGRTSAKSWSHAGRL